MIQGPYENLSFETDLSGKPSFQREKIGSTERTAFAQKVATQLPRPN